MQLKQKLDSDQRGIGLLPLLFIAGAVFLILISGYAVIAVIRNQSSQDAGPRRTETTTIPSDATNSLAGTKLVRWDVDAAGNWKAVDPDPPTCPVQPMMQSPADLAYLTLTQYPGQLRGGHYATFGTLTFAGISPDAVTITAPMDAVVLRGARYISAGETQYVFDFVNSCGVMYRLGHLRTLTSALAPLAASLAETTEINPKMTRINGDPTVKAGDRLATGIGLLKANQPLFDFGVYDLRAPNAKSRDAVYVQQQGRELAGHGVCWFDWLPTADAEKAHRTASAQEVAFKKTDYCPAD